jgi:hypothetical protein
METSASRSIVIGLFVTIVGGVTVHKIVTWDQLTSRSSSSAGSRPISDNGSAESVYAKEPSHSSGATHDVIASGDFVLRANQSFSFSNRQVTDARADIQLTTEGYIGNAAGIHCLDCGITDLGPVPIDTVAYSTEGDH